MKDCVGILSLDPFSDFRHRLHGADFIVDEHHGNQDRLRRDGFLQFLQIDHAFPADAEAGNGKSHLFQKADRRLYRRMLDLRRDDVFSHSLHRQRRSHQRPVVGLRSSGGKINFFFLNFQDLCHRLPGAAQILFRVHSLLMEGGRIPIVFQHQLCHQFRHFRVRPGRCRIVQINFHVILPPSDTSEWKAPSFPPSPFSESAVPE